MGEGVAVEIVPPETDEICDKLLPLWWSEIGKDGR